MANYTQERVSVSNTYINYFLSQFTGEDYLIFADDNYYYCVHSKDEVTNSNNTWRFANAEIIKIVRNSTLGQSGTVSFSSESQTSVTVVYPYYSYSNIGVGTVVSSPLDIAYDYHSNHVVPSLLFALLLVVILSTFISKRWRIHD